MTLASGTKLGPYEIVSPLGAGGMGEVYRAKDTRLDRTVAIKVLPSHLSADPAFRQRFEREARTISSLSHPNICALHDVGHQDGIDYLVMEFLEGETLAQRLTKGPLLTEHALQFGIQIASALDKAHKQGIVHRDLKPGNIMLTKSGAKLLDFGLAKLNVTPASAPSVSALATEEKELTKEGTILGTIQYMAPEQLESKPTDARTDIFAFGEVLYEMITGKKAFIGKSQASLIAAILDKEPQPISEIQPLTPPALDRVVKVCLAKDPDDRWQSAHDVMSELKWIAEAGSQTGVPSPVVAKRKSREHFAWTLTGLFFLGTIGFAFTAFHLYEAQRKVRPIHAFVLPPEGTNLNFGDQNSGSMALSPDGRSITFAATDSSKETSLYFRPLESVEAHKIIGTKNGTYPFWSPDSRFIGFFADGKLKKVELLNGAILTICDAPDGRGGTWNSEGVILIAPYSLGPIQRVSAAGGTPIAITKLHVQEQESSHRYPYFLPDGKHFLYLAASHGARINPELNAIHVASLDGKENRRLINASSNIAFADDFLFFVRQRVLMAQHFDLDKLLLKGDAFPIAEHINVAAIWQSTFSVSGQGLIAYVKGVGNNTAQLVWLDRRGNKIGAVGDPAPYDAIALSPDGSKVLVSIEDSESETDDLWMYDLTKNIRTRFTFDRAIEWFPLWTPDGSRVLFATQRNGNDDIYQKLSNGTGQEEPLVQTESYERPTSWSADGRFLCYTHEDPSGNTKSDIWILPTFGDRKPFPFLQAKYNEDGGMLSPDARWLAYSSDESGKWEIYVTSFPAGVGKWQVSKGEADWPHWRKDGKEIIYVSADNKIMSVEVKTEPNFESGTPVPLFDISLTIPGDFSADAQKFLVPIPIKAVADQPITLVTNWTSNLPH